MFIATGNTTLQKTTSYKVVLPFYIYAAFSFLIACILLLAFTTVADQHYFNPKTLALTHTLALGWGTMIILGASHQLVPVLVEGKLFSNTLAYLSFIFAAMGIPLLVYGFYTFNMRWPAQAGGIAVNLAISFYIINLTASILKTKCKSVSAIFILAAAIWLLSTTFFGLVLVFNFSYPILKNSSPGYLALHAHMGIIGWFLLLVLGVASRLIPLFLISKYTNNKLLWFIFACINLGLIGFISYKLWTLSKLLLPLFVLLIFSGVVLFLYYCFKAYKLRIRKKVDEQMKVSLLSVLMILLPVICIIGALIFFLADHQRYNIVLLYGFCIFFGWVTAMIFGMTFKTLPFIVWNKVYHHLASNIKTPSPKELFNDGIFRWMTKIYLTGFVLFTLGLMVLSGILLKGGAALLLLTALLYCLNVFIVVMHKPKAV
jgi:hypothetical protein